MAPFQQEHKKFHCGGWGGGGAGVGYEKKETKAANYVKFSNSYPKPAIVESYYQDTGKRSPREGGGWVLNRILYLILPTSNSKVPILQYNF